MGPDGGRKDQHCAKQCRRQVQLVVQLLDSSGFGVKKLLDKVILRDGWLVKFEKTRRPGTVKSYLGALQRFFPS